MKRKMIYHNQGGFIIRMQVFFSTIITLINVNYIIVLIKEKAQSYQQLQEKYLKVQ